MENLQSRIEKYKPLNPFEGFFKYIFINGLSYDEIDFSSKAVQRFIVPDAWNTREDIAAGLKRLAYSAATNSSIPTSDLIPEGYTVFIRQFPRYLGDPMHHHSDALEINVILQGELIQIINGNTLTLRAGEICFLAPEVSHITRTYGDDSVVLTVFIYRNQIRQIFSSVRSCDSILVSFLEKIIYGKNILPYIICDTDFDEELLGLIIHLEEKQKQHHPLTNQLLIHGIETFLLSLLIRYPDRFSKGTDVSKSDADIVNLLDYIELNISTVTLESLAATFHYTPNYLSALIKEHYGRNFKDIVSDIRLRNAAELLKTSDDNMAEIAEQAGYADKSYFHRVFKARYGMTPVEYRRQNKTEQ